MSDIRSKQSRKPFCFARRSIAQIIQTLGHVTRSNFSCNSSHNDDDRKTLQVAEGVSHLRNISSQLTTRPLEIVYNSFSASLKSPASERRTLITSFSQNCFASCDWHVTRSNLSRKVTKLLTIFLLFLQLATQHFVAVAGLKNGVLHVKFFLQLVSQRLLQDKLQEKLPRVTWPFE